MMLQEMRKIWQATSVQRFEGQGGKFKQVSLNSLTSNWGRHLVKSTKRYVMLEFGSSDSSSSDSKRGKPRTGTFSEWGIDRRADGRIRVWYCRVCLGIETRSINNSEITVVKVIFLVLTISWVCQKLNSSFFLLSIVVGFQHRFGRLSAVPELNEIWHGDANWHCEDY